MRKHWLPIVIASLLAVAGLSSCGNADATEEVSCDGNVAEQISTTEDELDQARKDAKDAEGTPAESEANNRAEQLEANLADLKKCGDKAPADSTTTTTAAECGDRFVTKLDENQKNKVLSSGVQAPTSEEMRQELLTFNSQDPRGLHLYYNASPLGVASPINETSSLFEGGEIKSGVCFTEEAMQKYQEWSVLWKASRIEAVPSMPAGWGNTGVSNGTPTSGPAPSGNTEGWVVIFVDATGKEIGTHGVMKRCGNPVTPAPVVPAGPTDEPTLPGPETPPTGLTPKDPSKDVLLNPDVPEGVRGPGTTPVGVDPGLPTAPVDSPSGCNGPCPTAPPPPPPPPGVTVPSTNGGNTGVTAPSTSAPPPAPPTTSSPTVTVVSP